MLTPHRHLPCRIVAEIPRFFWRDELRRSETEVRAERVYDDRAAHIERLELIAIDV